ncbi:hypothetical protein BC830DRAFT_465704 [Chytriomyces sp. MP71]|nr:hypothetical protein BC830DRAFT_465704 [Chytriomyces sp. MP71]
MACSLESCSAVEKIISQCSHCDMVFCLAHRHAPDHSCRGVVKEAEEAKDKKEAIRAFVEKGVKGPTLGPTPKPASSTVPKKKVNYALELMKMKQSAKGDVSIPPESRVYLRVHFPAESSMNSETLYFHKDWPVGRLVDRLAISAQVRNVNNTNDEEMKLVLYNGESRERLPMNESLTSLLNAKKLQQAGSIIMERVSLPCTPL